MLKSLLACLIQELHGATENAFIFFCVGIVRKQRRSPRFRVQRASDEAVTIVLMTPSPQPTPPNVKLSAVTDVIRN